MPAALLLCLVIRISDGDTLTARCDTPQGLQNQKVRLTEIDAPEKAQPWGARSKQHLAQLCFGRTAQVPTQTVDRYGRSVARMSCEGVDANASRSAAGWRGCSTAMRGIAAWRGTRRGAVIAKGVVGGQCTGRALGLAFAETFSGVGVPSGV
jgi:hypothetical protein